MSVTLREVRQHLTQPVVLAALLAVTAVLAVSGPFRTLDLLPLVPRAAYWALVVFGTYGLGTILGVILQPRVAAFSPWLRVILALPVFGVLIGLFLILLQGLVFGAWPSGPIDLAAILGTTTLVSGLLLVLDALANRTGPQPALGEGGVSFATAPGTTATAQRPLAAAASRPPILDRLPAAQRGPLVALSAEDHYVRVRTAAAQSLVLMRLSDAIREAAPEPGLQVHRSHWVAVRAVRAVERAGDGATVALADGTSLPVSRRYLADLRRAGFVPDRARTGA